MRQKRAPSTIEPLQRHVICVVDDTIYSLRPTVVTIWWIQSGSTFTDVVQIPVRMIVGTDASGNPVTLESLHDRGEFLKSLRQVLIYGLGLPVPKVSFCSLGSLLSRASLRYPLPLSLDEAYTVLTETDTVVFPIGTIKAAPEEVRCLWSGYTFFGGEWSRMGRQRLIVQALLDSMREVPRGWEWLSLLRNRKVQFEVPPCTRPVGWKGGVEGDYLCLVPGGFQAAALDLRRREPHSLARVLLCFDVSVVPPARQQVIEQVFNQGYTVYIGTAIRGCEQPDRIISSAQQIVATLRPVLLKSNII